MTKRLRRCALGFIPGQRDHAAVGFRIGDKRRQKPFSQVSPCLTFDPPEQPSAPCMSWHKFGVIRVVASDAARRKIRRKLGQRLVIGRRSGWRSCSGIAGYVFEEHKRVVLGGIPGEPIGRNRTGAADGGIDAFPDRIAQLMPALSSRLTGARCSRCCWVSGRIAIAAKGHIGKCVGASFQPDMCGSLGTLDGDSLGSSMRSRSLSSAD